MKRIALAVGLVGPGWLAGAAGEALAGPVFVAPRPVIIAPRVIVPVRPVVVPVRPVVRSRPVVVAPVVHPVHVPVVHRHVEKEQGPGNVPWWLPVGAVGIVLAWLGFAVWRIGRI
jgi:hypothetical protein